MKLKNADELLEKIECLFKDLNSAEDYMGIGYNHGVGDSIAIIKNAPTIEAEPVKHGHWVDDFCSFVCSVCGGRISDSTLDDYSEPRYCPNCGAKMVNRDG